MPGDPLAPLLHYDRFLADQYVWMAGGFAENAGRARVFFQSRYISPEKSGIAIDLGAGCGFQAIPLADQGFRVTAVDISRPMLDDLRNRDPGRRIEIFHGDIMDFALWAGKNPELIVCMGDTLTHLPDLDAVRVLFRQSYAELVPGGTLLLSFRDYSGEPEGTVAVIPVQRDEQRIFLCRLTYDRDRVLVTDILFARRNGLWERTAGTYRKLIITPAQARKWLEQEGFCVEDCGECVGMRTFVAGKL